MLKFLMAIILFTQVNVVQAMDAKLSSEVKNQVPAKAFILIPDEGKDDTVTEFSGICCKRWVPGVGYIVNCVPFSGNVNQEFSNSCSKWGGDTYSWINADEDKMRERYGLPIDFK